MTSVILMVICGVSCMRVNAGTIETCKVFYVPFKVSERQAYQTFQKRCTGSYGEYRSTRVAGHRHAGVDLRGSAGEQVFAVGAGRVARLLPAAYRAVRPIARVRVWARSPEQAEALAAQWRAQGFDAQRADDLGAAVSEADIVSCATLATEPLLQGRWLRPGSHLDLIGSFTPAMREADDACWAGAAIYVDTEEALSKSGDLLGPLARGVITPASVRGTLTSLARGEAPGRLSPSERSVFKSVGTALEDLAAAMLVMEPAR